jgi:hypothetical protein
MQIRLFGLFTSIAVLMLVTSKVADAGTIKYKGSYSGSGVDVPVDLDSNSCFTAANGATVCTDTSTYVNLTGSNFPGGGITAQDISEFAPVPGTSCNIEGTMVPGIAGCTLAGSSEQGCEYKSVGDTEIDRDNLTGDLLFFTRSDTICLDLSSGPPFDDTGTFNGTITGGTGKFAGATGTKTGTIHAQQLTLDAAGHGLVAVESSYTGTITLP